MSRCRDHEKFTEIHSLCSTPYFYLKTIPKEIIVGLIGALAVVDRLPWRVEEPKTYSLDNVTI